MSKLSKNNAQYSHHGANAGHWGYGHIAKSLLVVFPLLLAYHLALLSVPHTNGVDFLSGALFALVGHSREHYLLLHLGLGLAFALGLAWLWWQGRFHVEGLTSLLLESAIYALTLGSFIVFILDGLAGLDLLALGGKEGGRLLEMFVVSAGAGVCEELLFRALGMGLGGILLMRLGSRKALAVFAAACVSAFVFSLAHHLGSGGEAFEIGVFSYRFVAAMVFSAIFYYRSLAHAVYAHFFYDFYVLALS